MIVTKHTIIIYALDPLSGQRVISAVQECGSKAEAEALGRTLAGMVGGSPYAQIALYTEYEEDTADRSPADGVASWDQDPAADPFPADPAASSPADPPPLEYGRPLTASAPARFPLGRVVATPGALAALAAAGQAPAEFLARHARGDWGDLCADDRRENELSLRRGFRLLSSYRLADSGRVWVITDADRGATTLVLPEEY